VAPDVFKHECHHQCRSDAQKLICSESHLPNTAAAHAFIYDWMITRFSIELGTQPMSRYSAQEPNY
jgi:hypothetical protein